MAAMSKNQGESSRWRVGHTSGGKTAAAPLESIIRK